MEVQNWDCPQILANEQKHKDGSLKILRVAVNGLSEKHPLSGPVFEVLVPVVALLEEIVEPLGCGPLMEKCITGDGFWGFRTSLPLVCLLYFMNVDRDVISSAVCYHALIAIVDSSSVTVSKTINSFFYRLLLAMGFYLSNR